MQDAEQLRADLIAHIEKAQVSTLLMAAGYLGLTKITARDDDPGQPWKNNETEPPRH